MSDIRTAADALHRASWAYDARDPEPITTIDGGTIGWTFAVTAMARTVDDLINGRHDTEYGWILTDGQVSNVTEPSRTVAADNARRTVRSS